MLVLQSPYKPKRAIAQNSFLFIVRRNVVSILHHRLHLKVHSVVNKLKSYCWKTHLTPDPFKVLKIGDFP